MPIWVFAEEKLNFERTVLPDDRVPIVAFSLAGEPAEANGSLADFGPYVAAVGRSAVFGGQTVVHSFISDLLPIELPCALKTTEFEFTLQRALEAYEDAYRAAALALGRETRVKPAEVNAALTSFHDEVIKMIHAKHPAPAIDHLRVSLIKRFGVSSFRIVHSLHMKKDADDRLVLSSLAQGAPDAFEKKDPAFVDFIKMFKAGSNANMTKYEFALLRKTLASAICFPVFDEPLAWKAAPAARPQPLGIVSIDSDADLNHIFNDTALLGSLAVMSLELSVILKE